MKTGDVVILVSGGPLMTIERVESEIVSTVWFKDEIVYRDAFDRISLVLTMMVPQNA